VTSLGHSCRLDVEVATRVPTAAGDAKYGVKLLRVKAFDFTALRAILLAHYASFIQFCCNPHSGLTNVG